MLETNTSPSSLPPDDALSAIFELAKRKLNRERLAFRAHDSQLQDVFRDLSSQFELLPRVFVFSSSGPKPYSPVLNDSIAKLQLSGLLGRENPDYQVIFLLPAAESYFDEVLAARLDAPLIKQLEQIAAAFAAKIETI